SPGQLLAPGGTPWPRMHSSQRLLAQSSFRSLGAPNQLSKSWPRRDLAPRTPPSGWRRTERLLERAGKRGLGVVADKSGHLCEGRAGVAELLSRDLHAPVGEVVHRRHADQTNEAVGQSRTR